MKLNHADTVLTFTGEPVLERPPTEQEPEPPVLTFRGLVMVALGSVANDAGAEEKARVFGLQLKFYKGKFARLTVDERAEIKRLAGKGLTPFAYGRLCEWLEDRPQALGTDEDDDLDGDDDE